MPVPKTSTKKNKPKIQDKINEARALIISWQLDQAACPHKWGPLTYVPVTTPGHSYLESYVDHQGQAFRDAYQEASTVPKWTRSCLTCGHTQITSRTKSESSKGSLPGTISQTAVPDFSRADSTCDCGHWFEREVSCDACKRSGTRRNGAWLPQNPTS